MGYTPMMQQYLETKSQYPDCILFYRLGDFYEMFFEDALTASKVMEVALTGKNCGMEERAPMCGVPHHSAEIYIAKLVSKGYKVAICEQMEDPAQAKGIVRREVVKILTPGTVVSSSMLDETRNNYLACIFDDDYASGLAYTDLSTGELCCGQFTGEGRQTGICNELSKISAREILFDSEKSEALFAENVRSSCEGFFNGINTHFFDEKPCISTINRQFGVESTEGLGIGDKPAAAVALGALLQYLQETQKQTHGHIIHLNVIDTASHMSLDRATLRNLELTETLYEREVKGSLLGVLDRTGTAMGSRRMKQWLREPLNNSEEINLRLDAVEYFSDNFLVRNDIREALKNIYDLERLAGRIACGASNPRDFIALKRSVSCIPDIKTEISGTGVKLLDKLNDSISQLREVYSLIEDSILDEPALTLKDGGIIRDGFSESLDRLKLSIKDGREWLAGLEAAERERTGIKTLKLGFNKVFGYYIEVSKGNAANVPEDYIRKQTLVNNERFITPEMKEVEAVVLGAEAKINSLEYEIFIEIRQKLQEYIEEIQETAAALSVLDVLTSFAEVSSSNGYVRPTVNEGSSITIEKGRHPVIEQTIKDGNFVSNDMYADRDEHSLLLITGPNMAGKSTYMRQNALIVLMAQAGCFVPCQRAIIGVVDRIYTRIGASDNLARGQSTFYVEMSELAYILNTATEKSLIILDEIGRGTSTYDGLSIAWAVIEHLINKIKIRTLFATHYHELTVLENRLRGLKNLNVDVQEENGRVVFLHRIVEGSADQSYGIHVARIAGVPASILERAQIRLSELENDAARLNTGISAGQTVSAGWPDENTGCHSSEADADRKNSDGNSGTAPDKTSAPLPDEAPQKQASRKTGTKQLSLFDLASDPVIDKIRSLDLMNITPSQAFLILEELKEAVDS